MFENVLYQSASRLLKEAIQKNTLPPSVLFAGPAGSGKLTSALETARVLSCVENPKGKWECKCESCLRHKSMVSPNLLLVGSGNKTLEISASKHTLLQESINNSNHIEAARYLYIRAVRKLTTRFNPVLWEDDDKISKISPIVQEIEELIEPLEPAHNLIEHSEIEKILNQVQNLCEKLESSFLYENLPINQIRNISSWAHLSANNGKKIVIIENAEKMIESSRNALLKILEEPPEDVVFILTTSNRGAILPTILSRVRTYNFFERSLEQQINLIERVYHSSPKINSQNKKYDVNDFLLSYLPVNPDLIKFKAKEFYDCIAQGHIADTKSLCEECGNFQPKILFKIFMQELFSLQRYLFKTSAGCESSAKIVKELGRIYNNVTVFNQNPRAALEELTRNIMQINYLNNGILRNAEQ